MEVSCPNCAFTRHVPEDKMPATAVMATCPRCKTRFAFRERVAQPASPAQAAPGHAEQTPRAQAAVARAMEPRQPVAAPQPVAEPVPVAVADPAPVAPAPQPFQAGEAHAVDAHSDTAREDLAASGPAAQAAEAHGDQPHVAPSPGIPEASEPRYANAQAEEPVRPARVRPEPQPEPEPEPVRKPDIWSRLSAMGQAGHRPEPAQAQEQPRREPARPKDGDDDDSPWARFDKLKSHTPEQAVNLFSDMRGILTAPARFFGGPGLARGLKDALLFNLVVSEFVVIAHFLGAVMGTRGTMFSADNPFLPADLPAALPLTFLMMLLVVPFSIVMGALAGSGLTHVLLLAFRMAKGGFATTFRVVCYSTAPTIFTIVPLFASFLPPPVRVIFVFGIVVWQMTLEVLGLSKSHQAALPQTVAAVLGKWTFFILVLGVLAGNTLS